MPLLEARGSGSVFGYGLMGSTKVPFVAGNKSVESLYFLATEMANGVTSNVSPTSGGTLTVNGVSLGSYDYTLKSGSQTVSSFTSSDWFTNTEDSRSAWVVVDGNLTINSGQVFIPSTRKLFTCLMVKGNLVVNGEISMTARGANHSTSGSNIAAGSIRIINGTYSGVSNPQIPLSGGSGGAGGVDPDGAWGGSGKGQTGGSASGGGTGGGGGGRHYLPTYPNSIARGGIGAAGTSFSGGSAGGAALSGYFSAMNIDAQANGGYGGDGYNYYAGSGYPGSAGNPTGKSYYGSASVPPQQTASGVTGTGGVLIIFVTGTYSGTGSVTAQGSYFSAGSASGGGSVTIIANSDSGPTPNANSVVADGGDGGAGTARKLVLV